MGQRVNYFKQSQELANKLLELSQTLTTSSLGPTLLDLINIRASLLNGCAFCVDMHVKEAKIHGERELRIYHIPIWRESTLFSAKERALLEWTEAVTKLPEHGIPDEIFQRVRGQLSEKEISDATIAIGVINLWNRLGISFTSVPGSFDATLGLSKAGLN